MCRSIERINVWKEKQLLYPVHPEESENVSQKHCQKNMMIINYSNSEESANNVLAQLDPSGHHKAIKCNVAKGEEVEAMMKEIIDTYGHIDVIVNNAGITRDNLLLRMSEEDFDSVIDVNLKGCYNCIRYATRQMMKQRSGCIVNMASVVGIMGNAGQANYAASKGGVIALTKKCRKRTCRPWYPCERCCTWFY